MGRFRRTFLDKPLAALLVILLAPSFSWSESLAGPGTRINTLHAQIIGGCTPSPANAIIQTVCPGGVPYAPDLYQFESDSVNAYLALHNLPASDAHLIYDAGRTDLRSAVRATMLSTLLGIIATPAATRTVHQQTLYNWLQSLMQQNEIAEYTLAISQYHAWQNDPCHFTLDAAIAAQYGLSYDGAPYCIPLGQVFGGPPMPAESYFLSYGLENSYGKSAQTNPNFGALVAGTGLSLGEVEGIGLAAGSVIGTGLAVPIAVSAVSAIQFFAVFGSSAGGSIGGTELFITSGAAVDALGPAFLAAGPVAIILIAVTIGVAAGFQAFSNQQTIQDLNNLSNNLSQVTNTKPDLNSFATDTTGLGMLKMSETLAAQTLPDFPSIAALPAHQVGTDPSFSITRSGGSASVSQILTYQDWTALNWSAQTYGGWFVQKCTSGTTCVQTDSILASIHYVDWSGTKWTGSRIGLNFVSTKLNPAATDAVCPANGTTGVSPGTKFGACSSYVSSSIPITDANGNPITVSLTFPPIAPSFTAANLNFTTGQTSSVAIAASGSPAPIISLSSATTLPAGLNFTAGPNPGTASLNYSTAAAGIYPVVLTASSTAGTTSQTFTVTVTAGLRITSSSQFVSTAQLPASFLVTTTGSLPMSLSWAFGANSDGFSFVDNGNGTATISGTPSSAGISNCLQVVGQPPCGIMATNSQGTTSQSFGYTVFPSPTPNLVSSSATFTAGIQNSVRVATTGATTPVSFLFGAQPSWLSFHDNGDGSGVLSGLPPSGTTGAFQFQVQPFAAGNGLAISTNNFNLNVNDAPVFVSPGTASFTVGTASSFAVQTNGAPVSASGITLPQGLTFLPGNPASISGLPVAGTGGVQTVLLTAADSGGSTSQTLSIQVYEAPKIASAVSTIFFTGMPGSFAVTTTGYPNVSIQPVSSNPIPPTSPGQGQGMYFTVGGIPSDLQYSNLNAQGLATGTLTIQGTPSAADAGIHKIQITAQNGVGITAQQTLTLAIVGATMSVPASGKTCNGTYTGTFNGSITVSTGQNCTFINGGGTTGDVTVNGGNLAVSSGIISGNLQVLGSSGIFLGQGTQIGGNVSIQAVSSGATTHEICGTTVLGNLDVVNNAIYLKIGSASPNSCPGNRIGGHLAVNSNGMPIAVYNNSVKGRLSCSSDAAIAGGGNTAEHKLGQCSTF